MPAVRYDLPIEQGATYTVAFEWRADDGSDPPAGALVDTAGYTPHLQIRTTAGGSVLADLSEGHGLHLAGGVLTVRLGADLTAAMTRGGLYDLELHSVADATDVIRLAYGAVTLSPQVTEP